LGFNTGHFLFEVIPVQSVLASVLVMSAPLDANALGQLAVRLGLITDQQYRDTLGELGDAMPTAESMLRLLERKAYLSPWQGSKLIKGDTDGYFLGGYRLLYKIASGTFGRVFRADNPTTGETVAVKVLRRRWLEQKAKIELFEREGRVGLTMQHPNIVQIIAVNKDQHSGQYFIVMEFVEGGNLRDIISIRKKIAPQEALRILEEATTGLGYALSKGLTHRDIKASNILIATNGVAKLVDFGLAEITGSAAGEDATEVDQSVDYAGLEQATNCKPGDIRSDIYFLGCVLYQMLKGQMLLAVTRDLRARKNPNRFNIANTIRRDDPDFPPAVAALMMKMISFDPADRFQTPHQVLEAIRNVRQDLDGTAQSAKTAIGPKTIYVIEHNSKLQDAFRDRLKEKGYRVLISIDIQKALTRYRQQPFHGLIVDAGTAGREGIEILQKVLADAKATSLDMAGIVILSEDQNELRAQVPEDPHITILNRPVTMRQVTDFLTEHVPVEHHE
jgi:eukaryotic-like serine/threonine-protein kinase